MRFSVLINCYNYEAFVAEAVRSVGAQSVRPHELIVVDDGSRDASAEVAEEAIREIGFGRLLRQENQGQLAAFETGIEAATGDWIVFLDADDIHAPDHLERLAEAIAAQPELDFLFTDAESFGDGPGQPFCFRGPYGDLGFSALLVIAGCLDREAFVGGVTSTLCIRRRVLERLFPFGRGMKDQWRIRADNVLVLGASVAGARKGYLRQATVMYRLHGANRFAGKKQDRTRQAGERLASERLLGELLRKISYHRGCLASLGVEYRGIPSKNKFLRSAYWKAALLMDTSMWIKLKVLYTMVKSDFSRGSSGEEKIDHVRKP